MNSDPSTIVLDLARAFGADEPMLMTQIGALTGWLQARFDHRDRERAVDACRTKLGLDDRHARRLADMAGIIDDDDHRSGSEIKVMNVVARTVITLSAKVDQLDEESKRALDSMRELLDARDRQLAEHETWLKIERQRR